MTYFTPGIDSSQYYYLKVRALSSYGEVNYRLHYRSIAGPTRTYVNLLTPTGGEVLIGEITR
jgi:hypothetical protein